MSRDQKPARIGTSPVKPMEAEKYAGYINLSGGLLKARPTKTFSQLLAELDSLTIDENGVTIDEAVERVRKIRDGID